MTNIEASFPRRLHLLDEVLASSQRESQARSVLAEALAEARAAHFIRRRAIAACGLADKRLSAAVRDAEAAACDANLALGAYGAAVYGATAPEVVSS